MCVTVYVVRSRLADLMEEHMEELATLESLDSGAVYTLALKTHIGFSIETFRYFAGWCDKIHVSTHTPCVAGLHPPLRVRPFPSTMLVPTETSPSLGGNPLGECALASEVWYCWSAAAVCVVLLFLGTILS